MENVHEKNKNNIFQEKCSKIAVWVGGSDNNKRSATNIWCFWDAEGLYNLSCKSE